MKIIFLLLLLISILSYKSADKDAGITLPELQKLYKDYYLASEVDSMPWNGSVANCNAGTLPKEILLKAEKRINFFRLVNRLPAITINRDSTGNPQAAALMFLANDELEHFPPKTWKCYTQAGASGAASSCIGFSQYKSFPDEAFITGFIDDLGEENYFVGHRRWLLYSRMKEFSYGATGGTEAIYCMTEHIHLETSDLPFTAYPWNGYVPYDLIYSKWSFSIPHGNTVSFANARVTATDGYGKVMDIKQYPTKTMMDPTLVWNMNSLFTEEEVEMGDNCLKSKGYIGQEIKIKVENVKVNNVVKTCTYSVKIVDMEHLSLK